MKILYISNSRIPTEKAYGIQIMKTCEAFGLQNKKIELVLPTRKNKKFKNISPFDYYSVKNCFRIKKIKTCDPNFLMKLPKGIYIKFQGLFFILRLFFYLLFKKNKSEYIFYTRDEYLLPLLHKFSDKVIWEAHTLPKNTDRYLKSWQKCYKIITISKALKSELESLNIKQEKMFVAHDGVDLEEFELSAFNLQKSRKKLGLPLDKKIIMYTGHLYDWKGVQVLADSTNFLLDNQMIVFVGGTHSDIKIFQKKNMQLIKDNKILLLGHKNPKLIPEYLQSADVLILPNSAKDNKSKWTSPMKLFEYMASGVPIVASGLPSIKEVLNKDNSILVSPDSPRDIFDGIKIVLDNKELSNKISKQALQDVQDYTWNKRAEKILEFIQ